jgi:hypothetical protein
MVLTRRNNSRRNVPRRALITTRPALRNTQQAVVAMYAPRRLNAPIEPPEVQNTVRVTKTVQLFLTTTSATSGTTLTVARISSAVPGGLTYWSKIRIQSLRIWASELTAGSGNQPTLRVDANTGGVDQPTISWTDSGTQGQRRPAIAFSPGLRFQAEWFGTAAVAGVAVLSVSDSPSAPFLSGETLVVQAVVELVSPNLS